MDFMNLIAQRYSVRAYQPVPVENEKLQQILEAARLAPTAANRQPVRVLVVHTEGRQEELQRVYRRAWFTQAPIILAVCGVPEESWTRKDDSKASLDIDAAIIMDHIVLAATALGLGTCWIAAFDPQAAREVLELPESVQPILFTPLGYAADAPAPKKRRTLEELVKYERW